MIHREVHDDVLVLRMEHGKVQALDVELCDELSRACEAAGAAPERAVVLTGTGGAFSAGVDLFRIRSEGADYVARFLPALSRAMRALFELDKPVVAAANGHAIAGGCILVAACDHRLMAAGKARIGVPELLVGVPFPSVALEVLRFATPPEFLQRLVYSGETLLAEEALSVGLVDEVVEAESILDHALRVAGEMGAIPASTWRLSKRSLRAPSVERMDRAGDLDREIQALWASEEVLEAIGDYLERTLGKRG